MRKSAGRHLRRGRARRVSRRTGERGALLSQGLRRMISRRVDGLPGRLSADRHGAGRGLSDKDLSAAVVDISRLVTAAARLGKLEEAEADRKDERPMGVRVAEFLRGFETAADGPEGQVASGG